MAGGHVPMRMCVVCRRRAPKKALLRYAATETDSALMPDPKQTAPGRGVYHCDAPSCQEAFTRRLTKRKLKRQGV